MISRFFIDRPIFAIVVSTVIVLAGLAALRGLPIDQYPDVVPPQVRVMATYNGASAEVVAESIAAPLEQQINGVDDMIYMQSTSSDDGYMRMTITFAIGTDPDQAMINVNNRVQQALPQLPAEVRQFGVQVNKATTSSLGMVALTSPDRSRDVLFMSNYALLNIVDDLKRIPGVGDASLVGAKNYSMRIWLDPDKLVSYRLTTSDVAAAIREQNSQFAAGKLGEPPASTPFTFSVSAEGRFNEPEQFRNIILRSNPDGSALRLKDVARIELGAQQYGFNAIYNGEPAVPIEILQQPGANALDTIDAVRKRMEELGAMFPEGLEWSMPYDTTVFVRNSIDRVIHTLVEAVILVVAVVFLFLQNWRATLIPLLAVPVSLIGTFAGMYALGFSINLLTLFGLVLSIGIVVDDAIVVLENVERIMREQGLKAREAARQAMDEVTGPVISIVLVLCAVFIPVAFMGGMEGEMYRQFAITIAISVLISGIVALTLSPALCALMLKSGHTEPNRFFRAFNRGFERLTRGYLSGVTFLQRRVLLGCVLYAVLIGMAVLLFNRLPGALLPEEDRGYMVVQTILPPAASLERSTAAGSALNDAMMAMPEVDGMLVFSGFDIQAGAMRTSAGVGFPILADWSERKGEDQSAMALIPRIIGLSGQVPEAKINAFNPPPIAGLSSTGGFDVFLQSRSNVSAEEMQKALGALLAEAGKDPSIGYMFPQFESNVPRFSAEVDRDKAKSLGVPINSVFEAMQSTFGALYVNDFTLFGRNYRVYMQSDADFRSASADLDRVFVRSADGDMIPLSVLVTMKRVSGQDVIHRLNGFYSAKISGAPAPGRSSGEALAAVQRAAEKVLSNEFQLAWTGAAYLELEGSGAGGTAFLFGLIMVFLILAAQYERLDLPVAILTAVPFAVFGAALAMWMRGLTNDLYFQVGLLVLIGLSAKNAILIVEFAVLERRKGLSVFEAARSAARLRFRPIVMTSLAFILGCLPLAIASGAGAASQHSLGTGVVGGMLAATFLATFFIPLFYQLIESAMNRLRGRSNTAAEGVG
ncbi:MAG: multidrug efflux RND transporter permease subunit [Spongiibacteraceae bacterium]|jgi:multidrug efflux pump|nr:multidrug efflux RND transporter permease subunit [Spongiibacteraceae bacterium]